MRPMLPRRRAVITMLLAGAIVAGPLAASPAQAALPRPSEKAMKRMINGARADEGLRKLKLSTKVITATRGHSKKMAAEQQLWHSELSSTLKKVSWRTGSENVGVASTVGNLHEAFMNSSAHRSNLLNKSWERVGIGIVTDADGMRWATIVFYNN